MNFEQMNDVQKRLHNAAVVLEAECDDHGFAQLQRDALAELEQLKIDARRYRYARKEMCLSLSKDRTLSQEEVDEYVDEMSSHE